MPESPQFGGVAEGPSRECLLTEASLADALDGLLSPEDQASFDRHLAACTDCATMLADAQAGRAWLDSLRPFAPEPPADLVSRILEQTSVRAARLAESTLAEQRAVIAGEALMGAPAGIASAAAQPPAPGRVLPFRTRLTARFGPTLGALLQTRTAMTAAMAFFSVALTLNLLGVHVTALRARDLTPSSIRRNASETNARFVRYYESFRVVYELESRVHDIQHANDPEPAPDTTPQTAPQTAPQTSPQPSDATPGNNPAPAAAPDRKGRSAKEPDAAAPSPAARDLGDPAHPHPPASATRGTSAAQPISRAPGAILPVLFSLPSPDLKKGATA